MHGQEVADEMNTERVTAAESHTAAANSSHSDTETQSVRTSMRIALRVEMPVVQ